MSEDSTGVSRRQFLKIVGVSSGAAACSPRHGTDKLIPLLNPPEDGIPGLPTFYRTICRECPAGCGVTARTREGRVIKLEGNSEHPINQGALCARGQAALQGLYDPQRPQGPMRRNAAGTLEPAGWQQAFDEIAGAMRTPPKGSEIVLLSGAQPGSLGALQEAFTRAFGEQAERIVYEPFDPAALRAASEAAFGLRELPVYRIDRASLIVSLGADLLEGWRSPVEHARMLSQARSAPEGRARLVFVGPQLTLTAANADEWLPALPGAEREVALALCRIVSARPRGPLPSEGAAALADLLTPYEPAAVERRAGLPAGSLSSLGKRLLEAKSSVVLPPAPLASGADATTAALAVTLLNQLLGNHGTTVLHGLDPALEEPAGLVEMRQLIDRLSAGQVKVLLILGADPVATLPSDLGFAEALAQVPLSVCVTTQRTATSAHVTYLLPEHHTLETFSDSLVRKGVLGLGQPAMRPLFDTRSSGDVLLGIAERLGLAAESFPFKNFEEFWRDRASNYAMIEENRSGDLLAAVREGQQHGGFFGEREPAKPEWQPGALEALRRQVTPALEGDPGLPILALAPDTLRYDGRSADKPWLQEIGDPMTTVAWATPLCLPPAQATKLGAVEGDLIRISLGKRSIELPAYVWQGLTEGVVSISAGSMDALRLLPSVADPLGGGRAFLASRVRLERTGRAVPLAKLEGTPRQLGRELARTVPSRDSGFEERHHRLSVYPERPAGERRWGMAIDLDRCTGCEACVAACYAENNLATVGQEQIARGRSMHWIRLERYLETSSAAPAKAAFLPMLCQQCGEAPCETVCPVEATYHNPEGLNAQVYNRCVGTRYCANNCPYKVRVFNFSDHDWPNPIPMRLNPDVTVREKGVMEKCTFCVQRIRFGENQARDEGRPLKDGDIVPACAQTCPAQAIVFGDLRDGSSRVSRASAGHRGYHVMGDQNTQPAITYLARVDDGGKS
ncbi:MAG: molybdopterin-dependent oxidoreductase [Myxococcales bacterium]